MVGTPFHFQRLRLPEVILVECKSFPDDRGFFAETFKASDFAENGISDRFVQDNASRSTAGVVRGLHYQKAPRPQGKLVLAIRGRIFDVAVDLRRGSPRYGQWVGEELSDENKRMLYIPPGFAHGFCALSDVADVVYKVTAEYDPSLDRGVRWDDPEIAVRWPITHPRLSSKDLNLPLLSVADNNFVYDL